MLGPQTSLSFHIHLAVCSLVQEMFADEPTSGMWSLIHRFEVEEIFQAIFFGLWLVQEINLWNTEVWFRWCK